MSNELPTISPREYYLERLPSTYDDTIRRMLTCLHGRPLADVGQERARLSETQAWLLMAFAIRMSSLAVRERDRARLDDALTALVFEDGMLDLRETLQVLSLIYDAASRIADPEAITFGRSPIHSSDKMEHVLAQFATRQPRDRSIVAMGFRAVNDGETFRYERRW